MRNKWKLISSFILIHFVYCLLSTHLGKKEQDPFLKWQVFLTTQHWPSMVASLQRCPPPHHETHAPAFTVEITLRHFLAASAWAIWITNSGKIQQPWRNSEYSEPVRLWGAQADHRERPHEERNALLVSRFTPVQPPQPRPQTWEWRSSRWVLFRWADHDGMTDDKHGSPSRAQSTPSTGRQS